MTKDCEQLWKGITSAVDKTQAVRALANILADPGGRAFVSHLDSTDMDLCVEILDQVSRNCTSPFTASIVLVRA